MISKSYIDELEDKNESLSETILNQEGHIKLLMEALQDLVSAQKNGANLERYCDSEIDELWDAAERALDIGK